MSKKSNYKVTNWSSYNSSLIQRGSLTIWISEDFDKQWYADNEARKHAYPGENEHGFRRIVNKDSAGS
jgi:hypothetical protein